MAKISENNGLYELSDTEGLDDSLSNQDILPTPIAERTWNQWHIASLWIGMSVCIPTYMLASQMIIGGLTWVEALMMILLGNVIVAIPMIFNGHAGTKYGIPFPVLGRASFGYHGIQIPSVLRAIVACGWFGIQTWLGGLAFVAIACFFRAIIPFRTASKAPIPQNTPNDMTNQPDNNTTGLILPALWSHHEQCSSSFFGLSAVQRQRFQF